MIPGGMIRDQVCPRISEACKSAGAELRIIVWSRPRGIDITRVRTQASGFTRTITMARIRAMARSGARNGARSGARNRARSGARNGA